MVVFCLLIIFIADERIFIHLRIVKLGSFRLLLSNRDFSMFLFHKHQSCDILYEYKTEMHSILKKVIISTLE